MVRGTLPASGDPHVTDRARRLMDLFDEVSGLPAAARAARVDAVRAGDAALADELAVLLDAGVGHTQAANVDGHGVVKVQRGRAGAPESLGGYRILRVLGQGGMGV